MRVLRFDSGEAGYFEDVVVEDVFINIVVNGIPFAQMMAYEQYLDELVLGHLYSSNVIRRVNEVQQLTWFDNTCNVTLTHGFDYPLIQEQKITVLEQASRGEEITLLPYNDGLDVLDPELVFGLMEMLNNQGKVFEKTGGTHSALIYHEYMDSVFAEDVGRFNALDKVVGLALSKGFDLSESILVTSGRLSGEMVLKAAFAGLPVMCSVSAPICSGVCIAQASGITLLGFVRGKRFNVYSGFKRISS